MLTGKEIMIGNWVYSTFAEHPCKVEGIEWTESGYAYVKISGVDGYKCIESLSPIPLTTDIFEKMGWEKRNDAYIYYDSEHEYQIIFMPKEYNYTHFYNYIDASIGCITIREMPITYLHELQNLMRLCGIKKEIEL